MSYRGKSKSSYGNHRSGRTVAGVQNNRSFRAKITDAGLKAPIAKSIEQWMDAPNRFDLPEVDEPKEAPSVSKEKMVEMQKQGDEFRKDQEEAIKDLNSHIITGNENKEIIAIKATGTDGDFTVFKNFESNEEAGKVKRNLEAQPKVYANVEAITDEARLKEIREVERPKADASLSLKKEPWEMTYSEFFDKAGSEFTARDRFKLDYQGSVPTRLAEIEDGKTRWVGEIGATPEERIHRAVLRQAIAEGKTIPNEVLDQYPDLKPIVNREYLSFKSGMHPYKRYELEKTPDGYVKIVKNPENETQRIPLTDVEAAKFVDQISNIAKSNPSSKIYGNLKAPKLQGSVEGSTATYNKATGWMAISFSGIPDPEIRAEMKKNGFRYNPVRKQWVAKWYPFREDLAKKIAGGIEQVDITPNWAAKAEHAQDMASKHEAKSQELFDREHKLGDVIPFGQPILVGHYSEKADRNFRDRLWNMGKKGVEEHKTAEYYQDKAERYSQKAAGESPGLIYRRIQKLEADKRKMERNKAEAVAKKSQRSIEWADKWLNEYNTRLEVEREKYKASGGIVTDSIQFKPGDKILTRWGIGELRSISKKTARVRLFSPNGIYTNRKEESLLSVDDLKSKVPEDKLALVNKIAKEQGYI